jgi:hypothetical protein
LTDKKLKLAILFIIITLLKMQQTQKRPQTSTLSPLIPPKRLNSTATDINIPTPSDIITQIQQNITLLTQTIGSQPENNTANLIISTMLAQSNALLAFLANLDKQQQQPVITAEDVERKRSLVLIGLEEPTNGRAQDRAKADELMVENVLNELDVQIRPTSVYRLGRLPDPASKGGPRLIKVVLGASYFQRLALRNWGKNRTRIKEQTGFNRLIVRPSLTWQERQEEKAQRQKKYEDRLAQIANQMETNNGSEN